MPHRDRFMMQRKLDLAVCGNPADIIRRKRMTRCGKVDVVSFQRDPDFAANGSERFATGMRRTDVSLFISEV